MELRVASWNLWGDSRWDERERSVESLLRDIAPDILAVQELSSASAAAVDRVLPSHRRTTPDGAGEPPLNIWFHRAKLGHLEDGAALIDEPGGGRAALWVRLQAAHTPRALLVVTTHLSWDDYPDPAIGADTRDRQARRLASLIQSIGHAEDAVVLLADLNDQRDSLQALDAIGLVDCYERLARPADPTQPVPEYEPLETLPRAVDKILTNTVAVPLDVAVPRLPESLPPPSDHWPVVATVRLDA